MPETWEQTRDRLREKFVLELYDLQKVPVDVHIARISEINAQSPALVWQMGDSFNKMVKVTTSIDSNPNARITKPTMNYAGALRNYQHPDLSFRSLPSVPEFIYETVTATTLTELVDKELVKANVLFAFPTDGLPTSNPEFENGTFKFWQPQTVVVHDDVAWNPPLDFFEGNGRRIRKFTAQVPNGWTIIQAILNFPDGNHTFNVIVAPTILTYQSKTLNDSGYDAQAMKVNASIIRIYGEKECTVFIFNQRYKITPTPNLQKQWLAVLPSETGLEWKHLATENA